MSQRLSGLLMPRVRSTATTGSERGRAEQQTPATSASPVPTSPSELPSILLVYDHASLSFPLRYDSSSPRAESGDLEMWICDEAQTLCSTLPQAKAALEDLFVLTCSLNHPGRGFPEDQSAQIKALVGQILREASQSPIGVSELHHPAQCDLWGAILPREFLSLAASTQAGEIPIAKFSTAVHAWVAGFRRLSRPRGYSSSQPEPDGPSSPVRVVGPKGGPRTEQEEVGVSLSQQQFAILLEHLETISRRMSAIEVRLAGIASSTKPIRPFIPAGLTADQLGVFQRIESLPSGDGQQRQQAEVILNELEGAVLTMDLVKTLQRLLKERGWGIACTCGAPAAPLWKSDSTCIAGGRMLFSHREPSGPALHSSHTSFPHLVLKDRPDLRRGRTKHKPAS